MTDSALDPLTSLWLGLWRAAPLGYGAAAFYWLLLAAVEERERLSWLVTRVWREWTW